MPEKILGTSLILLGVSPEPLFRHGGKGERKIASVNVNVKEFLPGKIKGNMPQHGIRYILCRICLSEK